MNNHTEMAVRGFTSTHSQGYRRFTIGPNLLEFGVEADGGLRSRGLPRRHGRQFQPAVIPS